MRPSIKKNTTSLLSALLTCLFLMVCILPGPVAFAGNDIDGIVAVIDNELIMRSDLDARMRSLGLAPEDHEKAAQVLNMMIEDVVVEKTYKKYGFPPPDSAQVASVAEKNNISYYTARTYMMRRALTDSMVSNRVVVTPLMIKNQYESTPRYAGRPALHLKQLVVGQDALRAQHAKDALQKGKPLDEVATEYGSDGEKSVLDLGMVALDDLETDFRKQLEKAKEGEFVGPMEIKGDYCLFEVIGHGTKGRRDLDDVRLEIVTRLENKQRDEAFKYWLKQIMAEYYIGVYF